MKFSEFCQKNAVAVALLAAIIALGFSVYDHFLFEKPAVAAAPSPGGGRFSGFGRNRVPRRSEAYLAKFRQIVLLREHQVKSAELEYKAGRIPLKDLSAVQRDLALAQLALLRQEGESRSSAGAVEALVNLKFAELQEQYSEQEYKSGQLNLRAYNQSKIALAEAELKMLEYETLLNRNETFAKLVSEFSIGKCTLENLKALVEAESIRPERRGGPDGAPRPEGLRGPGGHHRPGAAPVPVPGK